MLRWTASILLCGVLLGGCHAPESQEEALQLAQKRLDRHKAKIKYLMASEQFDNGQITLAKKSVREAIGLDPENVEYLVLLAKLYIEEGQLAKAKRILEDMIAETASGEYHYLAGVVAERYGRLEEARDHHRKAHELQPRKTEFLMAYAEVLITMNQIESALWLLEERIEGADEHGRLQTLRGDALQMLQRYGEAAQAYRQALIEFPDDSDLLESYAMVLHRSKKYDEAIPALRALITQLKGDTPQHALRALAECYMETEDYTTAISHLQDSTRFHPEDVQSWLLLTRGHLAADDLHAARRAAEQAASRAPQQVDAQVMLGYVLCRQANWIEAGRVLEKALRAGPADVLALCLLGQVSEATDSPRRALELYQRALDIDPQDALARRLYEELQRDAVRGATGVAAAPARADHSNPQRAVDRPD